MIDWDPQRLALAEYALRGVVAKADRELAKMTAAVADPKPGAPVETQNALDLRRSSWSRKRDLALDMLADLRHKPR